MLDVLIFMVWFVAVLLSLNWLLADRTKDKHQ